MPNESGSDPLEQLSGLLESRGVDKEVLQNLLVLVNPVDLAEFLEDLDVEAQLQVLYVLDPPRAAQVLDAMGAETKRRLVERFGDEKLSQVINALPSHAGADLIHLLSDEKERSVLGQLEAGKRERVERLMRHAPDSAGGLMTTNFVAVPEEFTAGKALKAIQGAVKAETVDYVYVVDDGQRLRGVCSIRELLKAMPDAPLTGIMRRDPIAVRPETDQEEVARQVQKYGFHAMPVTDAAGALLGAVTVDTVMDVIHAEASEDALKMAGVSRVHPVHAPVWRRVGVRLPWLIATMVAEILNSMVLRRYHATLERELALAYFVPLIMAMGGNVGLQSSTLMVRGLATGEVTLVRTLRILGAEVATGAIIGAITGLLTGFYATAFAGMDMRLGIVVAVSMTTSVTMAASFGTLIPILCHRRGIDPTFASGPFITALNDVISVLIYFTMATALILKLSLSA